MSTQPSPIGQMVTEALERLGQLRQQVDASDAARAELATTVNKSASQVASLGAQVTKLTQQLAGQAEQTEAGEAPPRVIPEWDTLDRNDAAREWRKLIDWTDGVLVGVYGVATEQLPPCWPRHSAIRAELSWLRAAYLQGMESDSGSRVGEWHTRWLPEALSRIHAHLLRRGCVQEKRGGRNTEYSIGQHREADESALSREATWDSQAWIDDIAKRDAAPAEGESTTE